MKFPENWLREWVNPKLDSAALVHQLTMAANVPEEAVEVGQADLAAALDLEQPPEKLVSQLRIPGEQLGLRRPLEAERQGAELETDEQHPRAGLGRREACGQGQAGHAAGAPQAEHRNPRGVGPEAELGCAAGFQAGGGDAGRGDGHQHVDVAAAQPRLVERAGGGGAIELHRAGQVSRIALGPAAGFEEPLDRGDGLAGADAGGLEHRRHALELGKPFPEEVARGGHDFGLQQLMRRLSRSQRQ